MANNDDHPMTRFLDGMGDNYIDVYTKLLEDFGRDGKNPARISPDSPLIGPPIGPNPPFPVGYTDRFGVDGFLDNFVNSADGLARYQLQPGTRILFNNLQAANPTPLVVTLVQVILGHQV